ANASTGAITVDFSAMTGKSSSTIVGTNSLTFTGGSGADTVTNGIVAAGKTQTYNLGAGNDKFNLAAVANDATARLIVNAGDGDDTFSAAGNVNNAGIVSIDG